MSVTKHDRIAAYPLSLRMRIEVFGDCGKCFWQVNIVAVYECENIAGAFREAFINSVNLSSIFFTRPISQSILIASDDLNGLIRAAAVDHDVFKVRIILIED